MDFWTQRVRLFAGWVVWNCVVLHHMGAVYLLISKQVHATTFSSQELGFLMQTLLSNSWALNKTLIIVNLSIRCWELTALTSRIKGRISLPAVGAKLLGWKCSVVYICVYVYLEKNKYMHGHPRTHTHIHIYLCKEGTVSQNIWDYFPEGLTLRRKCHKNYVEP